MDSEGAGLQFPAMVRRSSDCALGMGRGKSCKKTHIMVVFVLKNRFAGPATAHWEWDAANPVKNTHNGRLCVK